MRQGQVLSGNIDRFECQEVIGSGGNANVMMALGTKSGRCAIKILRSKTPYAIQRMSREIEALESLRDVAGIMPVLDRSADGSSTMWYAMPIAEPISKYAEKLAFRDLCLVFAKIAGTISSAHKLGFSHRDIKVENLLWLDGKPVVCDWGLVEHANHKAMTTNKRKIGSQYYIAPEMLNTPKESDGRMADVYSLAKVIWVLATRQNFPLPGEHDPLYPSQTIGTIVPDSGGPAIDYLLNAMTRLDPSKRVDMEQVERQLRILATDSVGSGGGVSSENEIDQLKAAITRMKARSKTLDSKIEAATEKLIQMKRRVPELLTVLQQDGSTNSKSNLPSPPICSMHVVMDQSRLFGQEYEYTVDFAMHETVNRASMGFGVHLLPNDQLVVGARVSVYSYMKNSPITKQTPAIYNGEFSELVGSPACDRMVIELLSELEKTIPKVALALAKLL